MTNEMLSDRDALALAIIGAGKAGIDTSRYEDILDRMDVDRDD